MIVAAILIFGVLIDVVGLVLTALLLTVFAAYARREVKLAETILLGAGLAAFTVVVFVYLLGQPLPAWWGRWHELRPVPEPGHRIRRGGIAQESRLCADRLPARHADRRAARHRADPHRDAAADHLRLDPLSSLIMLAGIYYGAQYWRSRPPRSW